VKASVVEANPSVASRLSRISGVPVVKLPVVAVDPSVTSRFLRPSGVVEDSVVGNSVVDEAHSLTSRFPRRVVGISVVGVAVDSVAKRLPRAKVVGSWVVDSVAKRLPRCKVVGS
jgi:hypothetical protein